MCSDEGPDRQNWQREVERTVLRGVQAGMSGEVDPPYIASEAIEKRLWERPFHCANLECLEQLGRDHVTVITTAHMRRFCSVECIGRGQQAQERSLHQHAWLYGKLMNEAMTRGMNPPNNTFNSFESKRRTGSGRCRFIATAVNLSLFHPKISQPVTKTPSPRLLASARRAWPMPRLGTGTA